MDSPDNKIKSILGFTLIELIIVIALLSIIAVMTSHYIVTGTEIYADTAARDKALSNAHFLSQRMHREIAHALPSSVSVSNNCLTFTPIIATAVYDKHNFPIGKSAVKGTISTIANYEFHRGDKVVIDLKNVNELTNTQKVKRIKGINADKNNLYFYNKVSFVSGSIDQYLYIINKNTSYYFTDKNQLFRGSNCSNGVLMAENIKGRFSMLKGFNAKQTSVRTTFNLLFSDQELPFVQKMPVNQ